MTTLAERIRIERNLELPKKSSTPTSKTGSDIVSIQVTDDLDDLDLEQLDESEDEDEDSDGDGYNPRGLPRRLRSTNVDPEKFNSILAARRQEAVRQMKESSERLGRRKVIRLQRAKLLERRRADEAERRVRERLRRQLARGQPLDLVHQSAFGYQMALKRNALEDDLLVQDIMAALVSNRLVDSDYAESLMSRLEGRNDSK